MATTNTSTRDTVRFSVDMRMPNTSAPLFGNPALLYYTYTATHRIVNIARASCAMNDALTSNASKYNVADSAMPRKITPAIQF